MRLFYTLLMTQILFLSCEKEAVPEAKVYPFVITLDIENDGNSGVRLSADITNTGTQKILDYGFVLGEEEKPTTDNICITIDTVASVGKYSYRISNGLENGTRYYVRSYIRTDKLIVYGNQMEFDGNGSKPHEILSFSPAKGHTGTIVEIAGKNFSPVPAFNIVKFGNTNAQVESSSDSKLIVTAPVIPESKYVKISVSIANREVYSEDTFKYSYEWNQRSSFFTEHKSGSCFTIGQKGYLYGGILYDDINSSYQESNMLWEYDMTLNTWTEKNEGPGLIYGVTSFSHNGKGYIIFTYEDKLLFSYNPQSDSWDLETAYPGDCDIMVTYILGNELYAGIGTDFNRIYNELYKYNFDTKEWIRLKDFAGPPRIHAVAFTINGKAYVGTGYDYFEQLYYNDLWEYNPDNDAWIKRADFPGNGRYRACAFSLNNKGYIGLGTREEFTPGYSDFWQYSPDSNSWEQMDNYIGPGKWDNIVFSNGIRAFVGFGKIAPRNGSSWSLQRGSNDLWEFIEHE